MTTDDLRAKLERATPGPWELATVERPLRIGDAYSDDGWTTEFVGYDITASSEGTVVHDPSDGLQREEDANLIVSLVNAAPTLLDQAARVAALEEALRQAAEWFHQYEDMHAAKGSIDGDVKARTNAERADFCLSALSPASTSPRVGGGDE